MTIAELIREWDKSKDSAKKRGDPVGLLFVSATEYDQTITALKEAILVMKHYAYHDNEIMNLRAAVCEPFAKGWLRKMGVA